MPTHRETILIGLMLLAWTSRPLLSDWVTLRGGDILRGVNLRKLDEVAFIRFATIYRRFADVEDLADEIESLLERRQREAILKAQMKMDL